MPYIAYISYPAHRISSRDPRQTLSLTLGTWKMFPVNRQGSKKVLLWLGLHNEVMLTTESGATFVHCDKEITLRVEMQLSLKSQMFCVRVCVFGSSIVVVF